MVAEFFQTDIVVVYFVYGLSFFVLGIMLTLQARTPVRLLSLNYVWFLAGFALIHGSSEWADMFAILQERSAGGVSELRVVALVMTAVSFALLLQFGLGLLYLQRVVPHWFLVLPGAVFLLWCLVALSTMQSLGGILDTRWLNFGQAVARYSMGFPGALITAIGLGRASRTAWASQRRAGICFAGGAIAFGLYAILGGIVVPPTFFFPGTVINYQSFLAWTGVPVQLFRAGCAFFVAAFLAEAFVVEAAREQATTNALLASLTDGLRAITSELKLKPTLNLVVRNARSLFSADMSFLTMVTTDEKELAMAVSNGVRTAEFRQLGLSPRVGISSKAIEQKAPVITVDFSSEPASADFAEGIMRNEGIVSGMTAPLMVKDKVIGVLYVFNRRQTRFRDEDTNLLAAFASQAAVAIDHARLYEQVEKEQNLLSVVVDTLPVGVVYAESHGGRVIANETALKLLGRRSGAIVPIPGLEFEAFRENGERYSAEDLPLSRSLLKGEHCLAEEVVVKRADAGLTNLLFNCAPVLDNEERIAGAVAAFVDITRLKELEKLREEFLSIVAHDLRAPITVIGGFASLLERLSPEQHGSHQEARAIENILNSTRRLDRMVSDLLDAGRIESNRLSLDKQEIDIVQLIRDTIERTRQLVLGHKVRLDIAGPIPRVNADPGRIEQCLTNLLSNAAKYSYPDAPITVRVSSLTDEVMISIVNSGPGISPADRLQLFTRFYRAGAAKEGKVGGLGLGLYITKGLVDAHGGRIWVESEEGGTTNFSFVLPLEKGVQTK